MHIGFLKTKHAWQRSVAYFAGALVLALSLGLLIFSLIIMTSVSNGKLPSFQGKYFFLNSTSNITDFDRADLLTVEGGDVRQFEKGTVVVYREGSVYRTGRFMATAAGRDGVDVAVIAISDDSNFVKTVPSVLLLGQVTDADGVIGSLVRTFVANKTFIMLISMLWIGFVLATACVEFLKTKSIH